MDVTGDAQGSTPSTPSGRGVEEVDAGTPRAAQRFGPAQRLRRDRDYQAVFAHRRSAAGRLVVLYGRPNGLGWHRLGLTVSRRYGRANRRVAFKRRCREAFRRHLHGRGSGWDLIVIPRLPKRKGKRKVSPPAPVHDAGSADLAAELAQLFARLRGRR